MRERSIALALALAACAAGGALLAGCRSSGASYVASAAPDPVASRAAFLAAYPVFLHPRCVNCHPAGDAPLQGDDSHVHGQNVKRGPDGAGLLALRCATCHLPRNVVGADQPPGHPAWRLPSAEMPLVFQGLSPKELAEQLLDRKRNGGKSPEQLLEHVTRDSLVRASWYPNEGRAKPPLSHEAFVQAMRTWIEKGAAIPE